jgi:membrane-associated phospholipid phosphatase
VIAVLFAASAFSWAEAGPSDKIALRPAADAAIASAAFAAFVIPELLKGQLAPERCNICDGFDNSGLPAGSPSTGQPGASLNGLDAWWHERMTGFILERKTADTASNVWAFALLPLGSIAGALTATGPHASDGAGLRATVVVLEASVLSVALVQGVKFFAARKRPFVRYAHAQLSGTYAFDDPDSRLGFPSGHTAFATALGVSLAMTATLEESPAAGWIWGAAAAASVTTASLRMIAEKHYFTDVAAGAALGAACGVVFPLLHRRGEALSGVSLSVSAEGTAVAVSGAF